MIERLKKVFAAFLATACTVLATQAALAQAPAQVIVSGAVSGVDTDGFRFQFTFTCTGFPTCSGILNLKVKDPRCSNGFAYVSNATLAGLNLSAPGSFQVQVLPDKDTGVTVNSDGSCNYVVVPANATTGGTIDVTWDGKNGLIAFPHSNGSGSFSATGLATAPPPVFPMTVNANITPATASATAQFQPRPQDVGKTASVFVFAHAPASRVAGAKRAPVGPGGPARLLDGGDPCVLAQVDSAGQLVPASAGSLLPAFTTVLGAQGQSVTLLNNAPTPGVAGATVFAGYGSDAGSMFAGGVYQAAVTVPGAATCTTSLSTSATPKSAGALSGLWYNAGESGWGIYFAARGEKTFVAWYTYDAVGAPKWYVSDNCAMAPGATGTSGTCSGNLFEVSGPAFFGVPFDPSREHVAPAGSMQVRFTDAGHASFTYTAAGQSRTVAIERQPFGSTSPTAVDFTDLWFNPAENGWGMALTHHFANMFLAWFVYDSTGKPVWYVSPDCTVSGNACSGSLYRTTGPAFGPTFAGPATPFLVGTVKLDFTGPNDGTVTYTVDGVSGVKPIERQVF